MLDIVDAMLQRLLMMFSLQRVLSSVWQAVNLLVNNLDSVETSCQAFVMLSVFHFCI